MKRVLLIVMIFALLIQLHAVITQTSFYNPNQKNYICIEKYGDFVFASNYNRDVDILNASVPDSIVFVSSIPTPGSAISVKVYNDIAYLAAGSRLLIFDISDISNPIQLNTIDIPLFTWEIEVNDSFVYAFHENTGLYVIDVTNPALPEIVGTYQTDTLTYNIELYNDYVFIANRLDGITVVDVSDGTNPQFVSNIPLHYAYDLRVHNDFVYATGLSKLYTVDISDILSPQVADSTLTNAPTGSIRYDNNYLYIVSLEQGLLVYGLSNADHPDLVTVYETDSQYRDLCISQDKAIVITDRRGIKTLNLDFTVNEDIDSNILLPQYSSKIKENSGLLYVANGSRISILEDNIGIGLNMLGCYNFSNYVYSFEFLGAYVLVATESYVYCLDVSDPTNPYVVNNNPPNCHSRSIALDNEIAYLSGGNAIYTYDVSNVFQLTQLGRYLYQGMLTESSYLYQGYLYQASEEDGLLIFDTSDPANLSLVGSYNTRGIVTDVNIVGSTAFLCGQDNNVHVLNCSDPANPVLADTLIPNNAASIISSTFIEDNRLYLSDNFWNQFFAYNISDINNIIQIESYQWNLAVTDFSYFNGKVITANGYSGVNALNHDSLQQIGDDINKTLPRLFVNNFPNPFNPVTTIELNIPEGVTATLSIYNIRGQIVKSFDNLSIRDSAITWTGVDNHNNSCASGIYFYRLESETEYITNRMVLMK
jgi:hypothetical protein